jgi:hypothetical protein
MMSLSDIAIPREKVVPEIADAGLPGRRSQMLTRFGRELPSRLPGPWGHGTRAVKTTWTPPDRRRVFTERIDCMQSGPWTPRAGRPSRDHEARTECDRRAAQ